MEDTKEPNTNTETNNEQVLASGQKVIAPIHPDIKPEAKEEPVPETIPEPITQTAPTPVLTSQASPTVTQAPITPTPVVASTSTFESYSASSIAAADEAEGNMLQRWTGRTRAYLAEYAVQLIVLGTLITLVNSFFAGIMDSFGEASSGWLSSWMYQVSIGQLAAVVAIIPLLILLSLRTGGTEEVSPIVKESNWRKAFLGIFLIVIGLTAVGYAIGLVYVVVSMIMNAGLAVDAATSPAISFAKNGFGFVLFSVSALLYARDYRPSVWNTKLWRNLHRYSLIALAIILSVVFATLPLQKQRGAYVDKLVVGDLETIISEVEQYASKERKLPQDLSVLDPNKEVSARLKSQKYEYKPAKTGGSYEVCANFKTDASDDESYDFVSAFSGASANYSSSDDEPVDSPSAHKKGNQCFKQTASGVRSTPTSRSTRLPSSSSLQNNSYDDFDYEDSDYFSN